jgi:LuxR family maltose regulon positive regulatory protein
MGRLLRVLAPSGYGKTLLVATWVTAESRCVRWVDLRRADDDPAALFATLRDALAGVYEIPNPTMSPSSSINPYVAAIEEGVTRSERATPFVLVLDDVHRVRGSIENRLIQTVVDHLPLDSTVVLLGRGHHDHGAIGRSRLVPGVIDVEVGDLAFEPAESRAMFESLGVDVRSDDVAGVLEALEGWPAGVRLAGEVLRSGSQPVDVIDHVTLVDYLRGEWVGRLADDELRFLSEVACLGRFTGDLCDEVLGRTGSAELLDRLHRDEVVVFALDQRREWYRLHELLVRWLSAGLRSNDPARWREIHLSAARYWERQGDVARAVAHVRATGDLATLEALVVVHGGPYFTRGLTTTVERWLEAFPVEWARSSSGLNGLRCAQALHGGDGARAVQWLRVLDESIELAGRPIDDPVTWWGDVFHAALEERRASELLPLVAATRPQLTGGPWAGFACWVQGALSFLVGDLETARSALQAGMFEGELAVNPLTSAGCRSVLSILDDFEGDRAASERNARLAAQAITSCGAELLPTTAMSMAVTAMHDAREGNRSEAARGLTAARFALTGFRSAAPWFNVITRLALVKTALVLDDRESARSLMLELQHHARFDMEPVGAGRRSAITWLIELGSQVDAMHVTATGSSSLTDAELRVLQLLPTNLSLADIAKDLFVSRNTVKTHAASIYRKLDASKRREAVERARAAGLLVAADGS